MATSDDELSGATMFPKETTFFEYERCASEDHKYHLKYAVACPKNRQKVAAWRFGPAQLWYDMLNVPETGEGFDYGFKLKEASENEEQVVDRVDVSDESFLLVAQNTWEEDIIWDDSVETKEKVLKNLNGKMNAAGWLPSTNARTANVCNQLSGSSSASFVSRANDSNAVDPQLVCTFKPTCGSPTLARYSTAEENSSDDATWYSLFPVENEELVYGTWEDDIIWDSEAMLRIPPPKILTLDPNDENIILGIPEDVDPRRQRTEIVTPTKVKVTHPHIQKSKLLLGKAGVINVLKDDTPPQYYKPRDQDPFNVSNDSYYFPRSSETSIKLKSSGGNVIQHSTPVVELQAPFIQTQAAGVGLICSKNSHRPPLRNFTHGVNADSGPHAVVSLTKYIKKKAKMREQERIASGGGDMFFMRTPEDLTGRDGDLILIEFGEEHPPLINQVGMCSRVKNYYKRRANKDHGPTHYRYGELAYAHTSPFLGTLSPGQSIQVVENNMYRAPIYEHQIPETDFLVIRTRNQYFIRQFDALFTAGQLCPLYEVPGPNSKQANQFVRDFLQVFIYRLFWRSEDMPKRIRMEDVKKAFPMHSEGSIRKRLKQCADFKRTGRYSNWWVIKPDFRLPSEEEIRMMVLPEQCCAYFSMIAAEQRLKDAGYGEKFLFAPEDDDEDLQLKIDDEVKVAPWNTTRAYTQAMKGKCLLQLTGPADPTGCGEGFSYVRVPNKPPIKQSREQQEASHKRTVNGTDADLRKLSLERARNLLRKFGVPQDEIKKLSRWEVIDVIRTLSNEKAKAGEKVMVKYSRGNRFSAAENQERYKEECQRIFELQNRVLASSEVLSTDEGETSQEEDDLDLDEMSKNIENMLANRKIKLTQVPMEQEERERQELRRLMLQEDDCQMKRKKQTPNSSNREFSSSLDQSNRVLKIYRTFRDSEGEEYTRIEIVRNRAVIDAYVKIRTTKSESLMKQLAVQDAAQKDEIRRERRRIKDRLRRNERKLRKKSISEKMASVPQLNSTELVEPTNELAANVDPVTRKPRPLKIKTDPKVKCGACGATGHMRTNRICPQRVSNPVPPSTAVALTEEQEDEITKQLNENSEGLVNVEGTKLKLSCKLIKQAEDIRRRTLQLKFPKEAVARKRRKLDTEDRLDYLKKRQKPVNRRRTDPLVELSSILEFILNEMRTLPGVQPFLFPVSSKCVPDYYNIVTKPMDLQTMRENLRQRKYQTRADFLSDVNQILENSTFYNGAKSQLTVDAKNMLQVCVDHLTAREDKLMALEKMINPLLDDDDQVALSFILSNTVSKLSAMSESWPFWKPVNRKAVKDYYDIVKVPMDLETIVNNVKAHKYHSREEFLSDVELIFRNCIAYNGRGSSFSIRAEILLNTARAHLAEYDEHLTILEQNIKLVQEKAEIESFNSSWFCADDHHHNREYVDAALSPQPNPSFNAAVDSWTDPPPPQNNFNKVEILAEDLHCSSEDGEVDNDLMEVVRSDHFDNLAAFERVQTGGPCIASRSTKNKQRTTNSITDEESVVPFPGDNSSPEGGFTFRRNDMHDDDFDAMMCELEHGAALDSPDPDFRMIGLEEEGQRFLDLEAEDDMGSFANAFLGEDDGSNNLWF